jgi:hypothetical protein
LQRFGEDVAAPTTADENLAPAVSGAFDKDNAPALPRGKNRSDKAGGAGANDDDRPYCSTSQKETGVSGFAQGSGGPGICVV